MMKQFISFKLFLAFFALIAMLSSCQKEEVSVNATEPKLSVEDAEVILKESLIRTSQEFSINLAQMAMQILADLDLEVLCDSLHTHNFTFNNDRELLQTRFSSELNYLIDCEQFLFWDIPQSAELGINTEAGFTTDILASSYTSHLKGKISELSSVHPFRVDGTYVQNSVVDYNWNVVNPVKTDISLVANLSGLTLNKLTGLIDSGVGSFTFYAENDQANFLEMEGGLQVTEPNVIAFTLNGDEFFILNLNR